MAISKSHNVPKIKGKIKIAQKIHLFAHTLSENSKIYN